MLTGPPGSGKSELVEEAVSTEPYKLFINCEDLVGQPHHLLLPSFARQVGYFPVFHWMVNAGAFIDAFVTATTGTKAGLASTHEAEIRKMLETVTISMTKILTRQKAANLLLLRKQDDKVEPNESNNTTVSVSSNEEKDDSNSMSTIQTGVTSSSSHIEYPVVVIEGYLSRENCKHHFVYDILTEWASVLTENHIAHVVFVSNNPSAVRSIGKGMNSFFMHEYLKYLTQRPRIYPFSFLLHLFFSFSFFLFFFSFSSLYSDSKQNHRNHCTS